jgi:hypothetical protein
VDLVTRPLTGGTLLLLAATPGADLAAGGFEETELAVTGRASSYAEGPDGALVERDRADFTTRLVVRRPQDGARASGTVVLEWLNVSSGEDAAPGWTYLGEEVVRQGHTWVGLSAQMTGVEGGRSLVPVVEDQPSGGLKAHVPERYGDLHHPGDAYCYGILDEVGRGLRDGLLGPVTTLLAIGQSQSAFALTTYVNLVQSRHGTFDGFLVHGRGGTAMSLGEPGRPLDLDAERHGPPVRLDPTVPVLVLETETDVLLPRLRFLPARQPDTDLLRTWEVAGTAHADRWVIGELEPMLGCPEPVNRGQLGYVARAALRALDGWARGGDAPPSAPPLEVAGEGFATDEVGNALGGVRTPAVEVPVARLSGFADPAAPPLCQLFGSTTELPVEVLRERHGTRAALVAAYAEAVDRAVAQGFVLSEDRDAVLAESGAERLS